MKIRILLIVIFTSLLYNANGQFQVSYTFSHSVATDNSVNAGNKIGIGYGISRIFTVDAYFYSSEDFVSFSPEVNIRINYLTKDRYKLYAGAGMFIGLQASLIFPVGVEIKPFTSYPQLSFRFNVNPVIGLDVNSSYFTPGLGICYSFGK
ncbi:MAG: hypothetical protein LBG80_10310 [Bacteroidales bacterium]|jgi:hypothetical protein|nr:hypothetical protein [Bacteroidales bacterium]